MTGVRIRYEIIETDRYDGVKVGDVIVDYSTLRQAKDEPIRTWSIFKAGEMIGSFTGKVISRYKAAP